MVSDDWRIEVSLDDASEAEALVGVLSEPKFEHELSDAFHDRVIVSQDDGVVFLYAGTREQAENALQALATIASAEGMNLTPDLKRWHPAAEDWEDPDKAEPVDEGGLKSEHEALIATERRETAEHGYPEFEVRADLPTRHDAAEFAKRLRAEGLPAVHRWKFLMVGASDEDEAAALCERIRSEAPLGVEVKVEGSWAAVNAELPANPFAIFGGLGA